MGRDRIYRHFCMGARALEAVGDRWSLLIVRDLLLGPRRFTDLARGVNEITPTRSPVACASSRPRGSSSVTPPSPEEKCGTG